MASMNHKDDSSVGQSVSETEELASKMTCQGVEHQPSSDENEKMCQMCGSTPADTEDDWEERYGMPMCKTCGVVCFASEEEDWYSPANTCPVCNEYKAAIDLDGHCSYECASGGGWKVKTDENLK